MAVRLMDGDEVLVEEQSLDRAVFKLELTRDDVALYPHVNGDEVHMRTRDEDGTWSEPVVLTVEAD